MSAFFITSDRLVEDDFSSSDGAFDISVFTKSLLSPSVSGNVALLGGSWSRFRCQSTSFSEKTPKFSRFSSLDNVEPYTSLIYTPLTLFIALLCY